MNVMKEDWDVIIIGCGPAGCAAGIILAQKGLNVLMIEKEKLPRHKICSGLISKESQNALKKLGLKFPEVICTRPRKGKGVKIQFLIGKDFMEVPDKFYNVFRRDFDYWMTIEANKAGAYVQDEALLVDIKIDEKIKVITKIKDQKTGEKKLTEITSKYVIGADGGRSTTRKLIYPDYKRDTGIAYQEYWTGKIDLDPRYFYAFMDRELSAGYAFCNMKEDLIIIGVGAEKGKDIKGYQEKFIKYLKQGFGLELGQMIRREACITTNIFTTEPQFQYLLGKNNVLLVGEAADLFNIMGEGIPSAIKSGINAAESIIEHIEGDQTRNVVEIYEKKNEKLLKKLKNNWIGFRKQFDAFTQF